jgi:hypothetical protein
MDPKCLNVQFLCAIMEWKGQGSSLQTFRPLWILVEELPVAPLGPLRQCQFPLSLHASILYSNHLSI